MNFLTRYMRFAIKIKSKRFLSSGWYTHETTTKPKNVCECSKEQYEYLRWRYYILWIHNLDGVFSLLLSSYHRQFNINLSIWYNHIFFDTHTLDGSRFFLLLPFFYCFSSFTLCIQWCIFIKSLISVVFFGFYLLKLHQVK